MKSFSRLIAACVLIFAFLSSSALILQVSAELTHFHTFSSTPQSENDSVVPWWNSSWHHRFHYAIYSGDYNRTDFPVEKTINFTFLLDQLGVYGTFDSNSVRVVEYNLSDEILEAPSQFDEAFHYDTRLNATGSVTWIMSGTTPANAYRTYHVYFDILENGAKRPANYTGVSSRINEDYVFLRNEKIDLAIRYKNGTRMEKLYFDRNRNGIFESNEEMIGEDNPYRVAVRVTDAEKEEHGWASPFFTSSYDEEATLTFLKNGSVAKEIELSDIDLKNKEGQDCGITAKLIFKIYKLSATTYVKTIMTVKENLDVNYSYEYDFLDHKDRYDTWYIDENNNGNFTYSFDYHWVFSGIPTLGFLSAYNSSGNGGVGFIPKMSSYSKVRFGEYRDFGPAVRFVIGAGTWDAEKKIELENRLFVHVGDWSEVMEETLNINNQPVFINELRVHTVDPYDVDLSGAEVKVCNLNNDVVRTGITNSTGWVTFDRIQSGNYRIKAFWMGQQVGNKTISVEMDVTIDPLECAVYSLTVNTFAGGGSAMNGVMVGVYSFDGSRISNLETNSTGGAFFRQLPAVDYVIRTYYHGQQFGKAKSIRLDKDTQVEIYEALGLGPPQQIRHDIIYTILVAGLAVMVAVIIRKKGYEKIKFGLLLSILILGVFLAAAYVLGGNGLGLPNSLGHGISATYDGDAGFVTVGDVVYMRWKDLDRNGALDDWNLHVLTSNQMELVKIDLRTSLVTPVGVYSLYEAETKNVFYLDEAANEYHLYTPFIDEPDFMNNIHYRRYLRLRFAFYAPSQWEVNLFCRLEQGKPYVQLRWEVIEKGEGAGNYSLYPQIIPVVSFDRLVLPANYTGNNLRHWNQKNGPAYGNPWRIETALSAFGGYIGTMHVVDENVYLHSAENYETQTNVHASSAFSRYTQWVHDTTATPAYFQYDFWVDWDGEVPPSSDIRIEVWVPDVLNLSQCDISYSRDGSTWTRAGWATFIEGNRGDSDFTNYGGGRHRLQVIFPASIFTGDDGVDTGTDYGDPFTRNDEYLVRLKVAYLNEGLVTYEFEDNADLEYGLWNMNDAWMWLIGIAKDSWSIGIIPSNRLNYLACQAEQTELYRNITIGIRTPLTSNSKTSFYTNLVFFMTSQAASQDLDSDDVWNMFDDDLFPSFPVSAIFEGKESLGEVVYEEWEFDEAEGYYYWVFDRNPLINDWNVDPHFTICLPKEIDQHFEGDGAIFRFERNGYYTYDVLQTNEIRWMENSADTPYLYQLYAALGLTVIGLVLSIKCKHIVKNYRLILILFVVGLSVRLYFQSLSVDFVGSDAAGYGNVAANLLGYGKLQTNFLAMEPHYVRAGSFAPHVTMPYTHVDRLLYPLQIASTFMLVGKSFFAIKSVDVICGALLIFPTFYLSRKLFGEKTAIIATLIVVFHPLLIYYSGVHPSTNILPALFGTVTLCSMLYESKKAAVVAGVSTILLLLARFEYGLILMATIFTYYIIVFGRRFWKEKNFQIIVLLFLVSSSFLILWSYFVYGRFVMFSTRVLGGGFGEVRAPTLLETLTNPDFVQIRLYNALYGWWYLVYQDSPFIFITALLGLLIHVKQWRRLSSLYLFPFFAISFYSVSIRTQPEGRFIVQYLPLFAVLSAAFIIKFSNVICSRQLHQPKYRRELRLRHVLLVFMFVEIIFMSFFPRYLLINTATQNWTWRFNNGEVHRWIKVNTSPTSVMMAYGPVYTFYTERETVDIPVPMGASSVDIDMIVLIIKRYVIDYLVLDYTARPVPGLREILEDPLNPPFGFNLAYWVEDPTAFNRRLLIYDVRGLHS